MPLPEATAIALLDRVISVFSIIVFGSIAYAAVVEAARPRPIDQPTRDLDGVHAGVT